jgi:hypothetical protein
MRIKVKAIGKVSALSHISALTIHAIDKRATCRMQDGGI